MTFQSPTRLWALAAVAVVLASYLVMQGRRRGYAMKFTNIALLDRVAPRRPGWRRHLPALLFLGGLVVLATGFAQPATEQRVPRERATIMLAVDTSLSMSATDVSPTRIDAARAAAASFLDAVPAKINVGLVQFNGNAIVKVAPTTDRQQLRAGIARLELGPSTAIGEAIYTSLEALAAVPPDDQNTQPPARIVLMSDGKTTMGRSDDNAAQAARAAHVPVTTIAFGTDSGSIPDPQQPEIQIPVPVDRDALQKIADLTNGKYYSAYTQHDLETAYTDIGTSVGYTTQTTDVSAYFIGAALVALFVTSATSLVFFSRLP